MQSASLLGFVFMENERLNSRVKLCDILRVLRNGDVSGVEFPAAVGFRGAAVVVFSGVNGFRRSVQCRKRVIIGLTRLSDDGATDAGATAGDDDGAEGVAGVGSSSSRMLLLLKRGLAGREAVLPVESIAVLFNNNNKNDK